MKDKFKSPYLIASSIPVDNEFNKLKNEVLRLVKRPMTADRFIIRHIKSINEDSILFRSKQLRNSYEDNDKKVLSEKRKHISYTTENDIGHDDDLNNCGSNYSKSISYDHKKNPTDNDENINNNFVSIETTNINDYDLSSVESSNNDDVENWRGKGKNPTANLKFHEKTKKRT